MFSCICCGKLCLVSLPAKSNNALRAYLYVSITRRIRGNYSIESLANCVFSICELVTLTSYSIKK